MKWNAFFRALIMGMALALVLAACATAGGGTPAAPDEGATQLAAKLNAMNEGSAKAKAKAEGGTVRIAGEVYLKTGLTVPAGVTLDLTAAKAKFELQNGAILTVDGAVNARGGGGHGKGWVEGGLRIGDGATVINGSGTINLKSKGHLLNIGSDKSKRSLTFEGVTLAGIADNDRPLVEVSNGGELVMKSGKITGNTLIGEDAGGGGVGVWEGGTFTMEGGEISGNSVNVRIHARGGGVAVGENAVFTMKGGKISGNSLNSVEDASGGGGVFIGKGTFTLEGGEISGNSATGTRMAIGGGIRGSGDFIMRGGTIYGSDAGANANVVRDGKGAPVTGRGAAIMADGEEFSAKWGTGGAYTKGGTAQTGGSDIGKSDATLIAIPK